MSLLSNVYKIEKQTFRRTSLKDTLAQNTSQNETRDGVNINLDVQLRIESGSFSILGELKLLSSDVGISSFAKFST